MKIAAFLALTFLIIAGCLTGLLFFAAHDAVSPEQLAPAAVLEFPQYKKAPQPSQTLKIVTYNIGYASGGKNNQGHVLSPEEVEANLAEIAHVLKSLNADIICLQEVDFQSRRSFGHNQMELLAAQLEMPYAAYVITWNKNYIAWPYWPPQKHFGAIVSGQAVLSRYPILAQDLLHFAKPTDNPFWYNWFYVDRVAQRLTLSIANRKVQAWNLHLEAFDETTREEQLGVLAKILEREKSTELIVAGDYNTNDLIPFTKQTGLAVGTNSLGVATFPSWDPHEEIDHILYKGLQLENAGIETGITASDHLPVWATFNY